MTCVVGLVENGMIWMGADSAGTAGQHQILRADDKVFFRENGKFIIGFTDSFRMGQLLRHSLVLPRLYSDLDRYMIVDFIDAVRTCFKTGGYSKKENEVETGGCFLVGVTGRLFSVESDFQVGELQVPFNAIGAGTYYALGSLHSTVGMLPDKRIKKALQAAEEFSTGVRGPFTIMKGGK